MTLKRLGLDLGLGLTKPILPLGGGSGYVANGVVLASGVDPFGDGNVNIQHDSLPHADSPFFFWACRVKINDLREGEGVFPSFLFTAPGKLPVSGGQWSEAEIGLTANTDISWQVYSKAGERVSAFSDDGLFATGGWHTMMGSCDANHTQGNKIIQTYVDDVAIVAPAIENSDAFNINFNGNKFGIIDLQPPDGPHNGFCTVELSDVIIAPGNFVDLSIEANRRMYVDADGKPVDPTALIASLTNNPIVLQGNAAAWASQAAAQGFTVTGSLTNATTSPSD